jgi:cell division septation protein DedD
MRTPETELYKEKIEVSLDGRQIFYLFFGGAVIASLVFVLGVMVGKRVEARAHVDVSAATSASLDPLAALDKLAGDTDESLRFRGALSGDSAESLGKVDDTLEVTAAVRAAADAQIEAAEQITKDVKTQQRAEAKKAKEEAAAQKAEEKKAAEEKKVADEAAAAKAAAEKKKRTRFTLQLSSFKDRGEADAFFEKMKTAGYSPYIVEASVKDKGTWYRVRLGGYTSYDAAVTAKEKFESDQKIIAYVTRIK